MIQTKETVALKKYKPPVEEGRVGPDRHVFLGCYLVLEKISNSVEGMSIMSNVY